MDRVQRPLSPHLGVYRWMITNTLSILHRGTGILLSLGLIVLLWWLVALASGAEAYERAAQTFANPLFKLLFFGWIFAFFYHLCNGIRHLAWDTGVGFEEGQYQASGWTVVAVSGLATIVYAAFVLF